MMPVPPSPGPGPEFVQSLERGLTVIRAFGAGRPILTLSEVARVTGLSRASARRFLHTLLRLGYVTSDGREFRLQPAVLDLGYSYLSSLSLPQVATPYLQRLSCAVGESSSVAVMDAADIVYVARVATQRIMTAAIHVGTRFPAHATSMGRVLLAGLEPDALDAFVERYPLERRTPRTITDPGALRAELDRVRERGWALVDQELEEGLRSVGVPVRDRSGTVVAAVNVSAPVRRGGIDEIREQVLPALLQAATAIETDLVRIG